MISRKTDKFSRVVAFITAFAMAMLTVTLIHRTTISAEESYIEASDVSDNYELSEGGSEGQDPADTGEESAGTEENPDGSDIWNNDPVYDADVDADDSGIIMYAEDIGITASNEVDGKGVILPFKESIGIYRPGSKDPIQKGETVQNGDRLEFKFHWRISNDDEHTYDDSYFKYDITDELQGVSINTPFKETYWISENDQRIDKAYYEIVTDENGRTIMYIEPRNGFGTADRSGSISLQGTVNLDKFDSGEEEVTLRFFTATVDVKTPSLDNSITPSKSCDGQPYPKGDKYYQKYRIKLENNGTRETDAATVIDIPGSALKGGPEKITIEYYDDKYYGTLIKEDNNVEATDNGDGTYTFPVGEIVGGGAAYILYEMEVDPDKVLDPSIDGYNESTAGVLKNTVSVNDRTSNAILNPSTIRPQIEKSGVLNEAENKITWTIKIHTNAKGDEDFTVKDHLDTNLDLPDSYGDGWKKSDTANVKNMGNGVYEITYDTELPADINNHQTFTNSAAVEYDDYTYEMDQPASVTYKKDLSFVDKSCNDLNADGTIGWSIDITVPNSNNSAVKSIEITDKQLYGDSITVYDGNPVYGSLLLYDTDNMTITVDGVTQKAEDVGYFTREWTNTGYDVANKGSFVFTIDDPDYLKTISGKTITVSYSTGLVANFNGSPTDIDLLQMCTNEATCTVNYASSDAKPDSDSDSDVYKAAFALVKDGSSDGQGRNRLNWRFRIDSFSNTVGKETVTFTDTLPEGYVFLEGDSNPVIQLYNNWDPADEEIACKVEFNEDRTVMSGTIDLTPNQVDKIANENYRIYVRYGTEMTEEYYNNFNTLTLGDDGVRMVKEGDEEKLYKDFTNNVSVTVGNATKEADYTHTLPIDNKKIVKKTSSIKDTNFDDTGIVKYTIEVNSEGKHLGDIDNTTDKLILTDTLGTYLRFCSLNPDPTAENYPYSPVFDPKKDVGITPSDGTNCVYDESSKKLIIELKNDTHYTITYSAVVTERLNSDEYKKDGIDDDARDEAIIDMLYNNEAELSIPDGTKIADHYLLSSDIYRSTVSIESRLFSEETDDPYETDVMYLKIKKKWVDDNNPNKDANGKVAHNESVKVHVKKYYADTGELANEKEIALDIHKYNDEYYNIVGVPLLLKEKGADGRRYVYKVTEDAVPNYSCEVTDMKEAVGEYADDAINGADKTYVVTVTNTYADSSDKIKLTVEKDWQGDENDTSERDASVKIVVKRDGKDFNNNEAVLNEGNEWKYTFENLLKYSNEENKTEYKYTVSEVTENPFYKSSVSEPTTDGDGNITITVTNNYLDKANIKVVKVWDDDDNKASRRSRFIGFDITQDNGDTPFYSGMLNASQNWTDIVEVPKYSDAAHTKLYKYSVTEFTKNLFYNSVVDNPDPPVYDNDGNMKITITNTYIPREQTKLTIIKNWDGDAGNTALRSDSIDFIIRQDGNEYDTVTLENANIDGAEVTVDVPKYSDILQKTPFVYEVDEKTKIPNYTSQVVPSADGTVFTVTNTFEPISITITKNWDDDNDSAKKRPDSVEITLWQNGKVYDTYEITGSKDSTEWSCTVDNLPKYAADGSLYSYNISEEKSIVDYTPASLQKPTDANNYQAKITNKYSDTINPLIDITVTKHWSDDGYANKRPDSVTFDLIQNNTTNLGTYTIKKAENWECTIPKLSKYDEEGDLYTYTVKENEVSGYKSSITQNPTEGNGYNAEINNVYIPPETINIAVTKVWDDEGYEAERPNITLNLLKNGESFRSHTFNALNDKWSYVFSDVLKYDENGDAFIYTVKEVRIDGYESTAKSEGNNWTITNKYIEPKEPDPDKPDPEKPDPEKPDPEKPDPEKPDPEKPDPEKPDPEKPDPEKPDPEKPDPDKPDPTPGTDPIPGTDPVTGTRPTYPPSGTTPIQVFPVAAEPKEPDQPKDAEDVSAEAGFFDEEFDAVRRDDMLILILVGIIITGTLILAFRHNSDKSDGKYHM